MTQLLCLLKIQHVLVPITTVLFTTTKKLYIPQIRLCLPKILPYLPQIPWFITNKTEKLNNPFFLKEWAVSFIHICKYQFCCYTIPSAHIGRFIVSCMLDFLYTRTHRKSIIQVKKSLFCVKYLGKEQEPC